MQNTLRYIIFFALCFSAPALFSAIIDEFDIPSAGIVAPGNSDNATGIGELGPSGADRNISVPATGSIIAYSSASITSIGQSNFDVQLTYSNFGVEDILAGGNDRFVIGFDNLDASIMFPASVSSLRLEDVDTDAESIDISSLLQTMPTGGPGQIEILFTDFTNPSLDFDKIVDIQLVIESDAAGASLDFFSTNTPPVPEPGTMALLGMAAGMGFWSRRRKKTDTPDNAC